METYLKPAEAKTHFKALHFSAIKVSHWWSLPYVLSLSIIYSQNIRTDHGITSSLCVDPIYLYVLLPSKLFAVFLPRLGRSSAPFFIPALPPSHPSSFPPLCIPALLFSRPSPSPVYLLFLSRTIPNVSVKLTRFRQLILISEQDDRGRQHSLRHRASASSTALVP